MGSYDMPHEINQRIIGVLVILCGGLIIAIAKRLEDGVVWLGESIERVLGIRYSRPSDFVAGLRLLGLFIIGGGFIFIGLLMLAGVKLQYHSGLTPHPPLTR
jgi:hypothetical protein